MFWKCEPEWIGQTAFIVAGGPSVLTQNIDLLRGRRVIAINSSVHSVPWADMLFFGDWRWFAEEPDNRKAVESFAGIAICAHSHTPLTHPVVKKMKKIPPLVFSNDRCAVAYSRTSVTAGIHIALHRGSKDIVLLGCDGQRSKDGASHHHKPHKWPVKSGCWDKHKAELKAMVAQLKQRRIRIINASPGSAWNMWPIMSLNDALQTAAAA